MDIKEEAELQYEVNKRLTILMIKKKRIVKKTSTPKLKRYVSISLDEVFFKSVL